jgi:dTDP-4-dehydrorhamnose 3,5-epimerase
MNVVVTDLPGVLLIEPLALGDERGCFFESFRADRYAAAGIAGPFVQDNVSHSGRGVLRGLHFQHPHGQGKLVCAVHGQVFDVAVDVRQGSLNFGSWTGHYLSSDNKHQLYVPPGFAHGFVVTSETAAVAYKCTDYYYPEAELSLRWDDPSLGIDWPIADVILSQRDRSAPRLAELDPSVLPSHAP